MRPMKAISALVQDKPMNHEERLDKLETETQRKLRQFEEALGIFKDIVVKFHEENEGLRAENVSLKNSITKAVSDVKDAVIKPMADAGESFVELLVSEDGGEQKKTLGGECLARSVFDPNNDEMERTILWMREKFGLPGKIQTVEAKAKPKSGKKKKRK